MSSLEQAVALVETAVPDATRGLPDAVFYMVSRCTPLVNVDLLIRDEQGRTLLTWREDDFYTPGWHIPGGIVRFKERWEERILAVAATELGVTVGFDPAPLAIQQAIVPDRATRGHFISLLFKCHLTSSLDEALQRRGARPRNGEWEWHDGPPADLLSVHRELYGKFIES
ncbi:MAG: NUDIX hydrolase [Magnetococcales bacterium]|nr:NUDIX hydrolase [Magnetococcales bacterium]